MHSYKWKRVQGLRLSEEEKNPVLPDIQKYLARLKVDAPKEGEFGITWLELYTLYKALGYRCAQQDPGKKSKARPGLGKQLATFKKLVRKVEKEEVEEAQKTLLGSGKKKGYALSRLGVGSHAPTLNCVVKLGAEAQRELDKEVLRAGGSTLKDLNKYLGGEKKLVVKALSDKYKVTWSRSVKRFSQSLQKEFAEQKLEKREGRSSTAGVGRAGRRCTDRGAKRCLFPVDDFVQAATQKCSYAKASRTGELGLRSSMLSAKLRNRFKHLFPPEGDC